ncbi:hypothetical protein N7478_002537 [Penicillium angulare]|uniref:uncharacterized protein n=1 Tax=Penicillium angulare TaxID=116970 RepID=UPI002541D160|nr:uncharacterized protein N7478_002537 [Penicillium angulare]KAJ5286851.1 hypothetical protein N7478_002537 [Penicillium angulare]
MADRTNWGDSENARDGRFAEFKDKVEDILEDIRSAERLSVNDNTSSNLCHRFMKQQFDALDARFDDLVLRLNAEAPKKETDSNVLGTLSYLESLCHGFNQRLVECNRNIEVMENKINSIPFIETQIHDLLERLNILEDQGVGDDVSWLPTSEGGRGDSRDPSVDSGEFDYEVYAENEKEAGEDESMLEIPDDVRSSTATEVQDDLRVKKTWCEW